MSTLVPGEHPLLAASEEERTAYLTVIASMAFADRAVADAELARLDALCAHLHVTAGDRDAVRAAARHPDQVQIADLLRRLRGSQLGVAVLVDAFDMACADGVVTAEELHEVGELARALDVPPAQVGTIRSYVLEARGLQAPRPTTGGEVAVGVAVTGVPAAVLTVAAALGAPLVAGVGLAAALGAGGYMAVRWLARRHRHQQGGA